MYTNIQYYINSHFIYYKMDDTCFEVFQIIDHRIFPFGRVYFKIIWMDYSTSWEPLENLLHCDKALERYFNNLDMFSDSHFLRRVVNIIRKSKNLYHDDGEIY